LKVIADEAWCLLLHDGRTLPHLRQKLIDGFDRLVGSLWASDDFHEWHQVRGIVVVRHPHPVGPFSRGGQKARHQGRGAAGENGTLLRMRKKDIYQVFAVYRLGSGESSATADDGHCSLV
jgi:hypothetical protein